MFRPRPPLLALGCALALAGSVRLSATTVYRCTGPAGQQSFQDKPCAAGQQQHTVTLADTPSRASPVPPAAAPAPPPAETQPPPAATLAVTAPLPVMYSCTRATDGKRYLSQNGDPAPYLAPYGVLGAGQQPLAEVYGADRGAAGMSAPEANRGRVTAGMVADNYVWVQDQCRALDAAETCEALQRAFDQNERQLRNAFKSQRPPLEKREAELQAQLGSCGQ